MKKWFVVLIMSAIALTLLVSCENDKKVNQTTEPEKTEEVDIQKDINDYVTIKEEVNREDLTPNGDKARYIYEVPVINIDTKGAQKINDRFFNLVKDMDSQIGNGQNLTININSKAFLNDEIISVVMEIVKPGPGGIHTANYDIKKDKELSTKELIERYNFDPQKLIAEINRQVKINEGKPEEEQEPIDIMSFAHMIMSKLYANENSLDNFFGKLEELQNKTQEEKERFVIENINNLDVYLNEDGHFVFIYTGPLPDEELVVE